MFDVLFCNDFLLKRLFEKKKDVRLLDDLGTEVNLTADDVDVVDRIGCGGGDARLLRKSN
jgi:hypothetical protein